MYCVSMSSCTKSCLTHVQVPARTSSTSGGKVDFISIARAEGNMPEEARIDASQQVEALVQMVLAAPITIRSNTANQWVYQLIF